MWTCSVEAAMEYSRIVYDIYPEIKLVTIISIYLLNPRIVNSPVYVYFVLNKQEKDRNGNC